MAATKRGTNHAAANPAVHFAADRRKPRRKPADAETTMFSRLREDIACIRERDLPRAPTGKC